MTTFQDLNLPSSILSVLTELGYENPTPIQEQAIPLLLEGKSVLAQAKTGTGKTASFALPLITRLDPSNPEVQALILAPTRELALQVADACKQYARNIKGLKIAAIYGGQGFREQLRALKDGVHIVVGTPGRIMDHMDRGSLSLNHLKTLVLDEADEMLNMGFVDDVKWIFEQIPKNITLQTALFSATVPPAIARLIKEYLGHVEKIQIQDSVNQIATIQQYFCVAPQHCKLEAVSRFLEMESFEAALIFVCTKTATVELSQALQAKGYLAAALNGDMSQEDREKMVKRLRSGSLNIVVATDVAARGLDVERIGLVINYDIPFNPDAYVHRIGRTGRAGRTGVALVLVEPNQRRFLKTIERTTGKAIEELKAPTAVEVNAKRWVYFTKKIIQALQHDQLGSYREKIDQLLKETDYSALDIAAALTALAQKELIPFNPKMDWDVSFNEPRFDRDKKSSKSSRPSHSRQRENRKSSFARKNQRQRQNRDK